MSQTIIAELNYIARLLNKLFSLKTYLESSGSKLMSHYLAHLGQANGFSFTPGLEI